MSAVQYNKNPENI